MILDKICLLLPYPKADSCIRIAFKDIHTINGQHCLRTLLLNMASLVNYAWKVFVQTGSGIILLSAQ
jgi:hypothetical protein